MGFRSVIIAKTKRSSVKLNTTVFAHNPLFRKIFTSYPNSHFLKISLSRSSDTPALFISSSRIFHLLLPHPNLLIQLLQTDWSRLKETQKVIEKLNKQTKKKSEATGIAAGRQAFELLSVATIQTARGA